MFELLAQSGTEISQEELNAALGLSTGLLLVLLPLIVLIIAGAWKVFVKAGKPGWAALVPVYNEWVLAEVGGKPGWWGILVFVLAFIPKIGGIPIGDLGAFILFAIISIGVAKNFGKDTAYGIAMLTFLPFIGYPILGFGSAKYSPVNKVSTTKAKPAA